MDPGDILPGGPGVVRTVTRETPATWTTSLPQALSITGNRHSQRIYEYAIL
jgi:hypothetical protein